MSDEPLTECQECGAPAVRVLHPVAVHFKGSGFYNTDYGRKKGVGKDGGSEGSESKSSESKSGSSDSAKSDSKSGDKAKASTAD
jgi:predicted nucleic acid-binding Zn ribbon protein